MYLVYVGESGNTGNSVSDPNQPHHVQIGLLVHESQSVSINGEFNALFRRHFGAPPGEQGMPASSRAFNHTSLGSAAMIFFKRGINSSKFWLRTTWFSNLGSFARS